MTSQLIKFQLYSSHSFIVVADCSEPLSCVFKNGLFEFCAVIKRLMLKEIKAGLHKVEGTSAFVFATLTFELMNLH